MIVCSSLLHELENQFDFLTKLFSLCNDHTVVHINVPNANSMHRLLALEMGIMANVHDFSQRNTELQQHCVFDLKSLSELVTKAGGKIVDSGSYFVKPFSHKQMLELLDKNIITEKVLDGLNNMTKYMPELGSEIFVTCRKAELARSSS